ncbi:MAG: hypothetical protein KAI25_03165, partial [Hyphomicrobiaceae bacterium]|nr:hypothetical protein [Hyphomicrobiaceae bacterium]
IAAKRTGENYPAIPAAIDAIEKGIRHGLSKGLENEARLLGKLAVTETAKNLLKVFRLQEKFSQVDIEPARDFTNIGVVGAGIMGGGIAQLAADRGIPVRLKDIRYDAVLDALRTARGVWDYKLRRRRLTEGEVQQKMAFIAPTLDDTGLVHADLVIEAVVENLEVKQKVLAEAERRMDSRAVFASNTSSLPIGDIAARALHPERVVGLHFFNPVHRMPLIEVVATPMTSKETIVSSLQFAKRLGKTPILVKDTCGFIVNRVLLGYINEAGRILEECGQMVAIDKLMTDFGLPMGPFTLSDEVGLDIGIKVLDTLEESLGARFAPVESFKRVAEKGLLGKKTKKGFYIYNGKEKDPNEAIAPLLGTDDFKSFKAEDYRKRMIYLMINEAARCLEDGVVDEPGAIDVGMIFGTGFPPFRGGLLRYADSVGIDNIVADLERFTSEGGKQFEPCTYLLSLRDEKKGFYSA